MVARRLLFTSFFLALFVFFASAAAGSKCVIDGAAYNEYDFDSSTTKCRLCLPSVSETSWSTTDDPCLCLCGVRKSAIPQACVDEIYYHGGNDWPNPNVEDAKGGGCGRNWCVGGQMGKMCCVTNAFKSSNEYCVKPFDKRVLVVDDPSAETCFNFYNPPHKKAPNCPVVPGQTSGVALETQNECASASERSSCNGGYCCKKNCVSTSEVCTVAFEGFGVYNLQIGDHVEIGEYDYFLADVSSLEDFVLVNVSKSGSVIEGFKHLNKDDEPLVFFGVGMKLENIFNDSFGFFNARMSFTAPDGSIPTKLPEATVFPKADVVSGSQSSEFPSVSWEGQGSLEDALNVSSSDVPTSTGLGEYGAVAGCNLFGVCGGLIPQECSQSGASVASYRCTERSGGKRWMCRQNWESDWNFLSCPPCPQEFTFDKCVGGGFLGMQRRSFCFQDYSTECFSDANACGSDQALQSFDCQFTLVGVKYCCRTGKAVASERPTTTLVATPSLDSSSSADGPQLVFPGVSTGQAGAAGDEVDRGSIPDQVSRFFFSPPPVVNITRFVSFPIGIRLSLSQNQAYPVVESVDNGAYVHVNSTFKLTSRMRCFGPSACECGLLQRVNDSNTVFQCTFRPPVNGDYDLIAMDVHGNDNKDFVHQARLIPGQPAVLIAVVEREKVDLLLFLTAFAVFMALVFAGYFVYRKLRARALRMQRLLKKKKRLEQELSMLKYRYLKREIDEKSYQSLQTVLEREFNELNVKIADETERQHKRGRRSLV
ncbi:MAG: hypothetical protein ACE5DI_01415 [Candidatus Micrarchaeia archaeon]